QSLRYGKCNALGTEPSLHAISLDAAMARDVSRRRNSAVVGVLAALAVALGAQTQSTAPSVAGVRLGMTVEQARRAVGRAEREGESLGMRFWEYPRKGMTVIWKEGTEGVQGIVVNSARAGAARGIKVGDSEDALRRQWGTPARDRQEGRFLDFIGAGWVLSAELKDGVVVEITLMAAAAPSQ
ncbi:MAG TPA: hypothetical protein VD793_10890, partial [Gemmatimonadales bacterium]|nr:hypothetical protein [Gemmatimonadales bacterium]